MSNATYKIRRLKWRRESYGWVADTPWGRYLVEWVTLTSGGEPDKWYATFGCGEIDSRYHATDDVAKSACQSDFDRRIGECLE